MNRELLERNAKLLEELRLIQSGKTIAGDVDFAARENEIATELDAINCAVAESQFRDQTEAVEGSKEERMTELALSFPAVREGWPGIDPWDQHKLNAWATSGVASHGEVCTAEFLLYVWNPDDDTPWAGRFSLSEALETWDVFNRFAFLKWAEEPFWP